MARAARLRQLDVSHNRISSMAEVELLADLPHLQELVLGGNPVCDLPGYRAQVVHALPLLQVLDHR